MNDAIGGANPESSGRFESIEEILAILSYDRVEEIYPFSGDSLPSQSFALTEEQAGEFAWKLVDLLDMRDHRHTTVVEHSQAPTEPSYEDEHFALKRDDWYAKGRAIAVQEFLQELTGLGSLDQL